MFVYGSCMASTNITLNEEAYRLLKSAKRKGESFSAVILRNVHRRADTAGQLLDLTETDELPPVNFARLEQAVGERKRRSKR